MNSLQVFIPSRTRGLVFHSAAILLLLSLSGYALLNGLDQNIGGYFLSLLLVSLLFFIPVPPLIYSLYALIRARYDLERDGLHMHWGLRVEDIPLTAIEWVRPADELPIRLPLPRPSWPGAILGTVHTDELGTIEFLASTRSDLLLVATNTRVFAISPLNGQAFLDAMEKAFEMGSLAPIPAYSAMPAAYATHVWSNLPARGLLLSGLILGLVLFAIVSLAIPGRETASFGFYPNGQPLPPGPASQLILLPIMALVFYATDLATGLFFFRWDPYRPLAYLIWGSSIITSILFLFATAWILL